MFAAHNSCPAATTYCPLGSLQQLLAGARWFIETGQVYIGFYVVGAMGAIGSFVGRMICGWACPLGAFYALFSKIKLVKLRLDPVKCTHCKACHTVCPMGVRFDESPDDMECISCLACSKACKFDAINLEIGDMPIAGKTAPITAQAETNPA